MKIRQAIATFIWSDIAAVLEHAEEVTEVLKAVEAERDRYCGMVQEKRVELEGSKQYFADQENEIAKLIIRTYTFGSTVEKLEEELKSWKDLCNIHYDYIVHLEDTIQKYRQLASFEHSIELENQVAELKLVKSKLVKELNNAKQLLADDPLFGEPYHV